MKKITLLSALLFASVATFAQTWKMDKAHAKLGFTITHMGISEVDGNFKNFDATIAASKDDFSDAVFNLTADLKTMTTNNEMRDGHLQKPEMFDTEKFPSLSFKSTSIKVIAPNKYELKGDLTIKGVTKPQTLTLTLLGKTKNRQGKDLAGFKATGTIKRTDFGVAAGMPTAMLSDEVDLRASGEFAKE